MDASAQPAWPGLDLMTVDSGLNPLLASMVGAPHMIRGTDPAAYATDARDWWQSLGEQPAASDASGNGVTGPTDPWWKIFAPWYWGKSVPQGIAQQGALTTVGGMALALLVVAFGLLVLWKL